ncbi:MAG: SagB/ThcOx family dehydrogenase [Nocardioides sp.]|nr:SagB/ThcOx family dehydrogenase [Nocardioides sp.]
MSQEAFPDQDPFQQSRELAEALLECASEFDIETPLTTSTLLRVLTGLSAAPNTVFPEAPSYRRECPGEPILRPGARLGSSHRFFDVVEARTSRRDFSNRPLSAESLISLLAWTFAKRDEVIAYDWRDAPLRYVPSAGGLASVDAYVVVNNVDQVPNGSYYYDFERGLVPRIEAEMGEKLANLVPGTSWLTRAGAVIIFVSNADRVEHKYQSMGAKLSMLDAGVAVGHADLVANALELRSCIIGALPAEDAADLLGLDSHQVAIVSLAVGSR